MGIKDFFQSVVDFIENLKAEFSPEFENKGNSIVFILFIFSVLLHLLDLITNFNRGYLINTFLLFYLIFAIIFYFFTLPSNTFFKWDNLLFCFFLSFLSFLLPIPFIYLSKYFPWIILFLVFTPIWPMFILYYFYQDIFIFRFVLTIYVIFWTIFFLIFFISNLPPLEGISPIYKNTVDVRKAISDYVMNDLVVNSLNVWEKVKEESRKLFNMIKSGEFSFFKLFFGQKFDEFLDRYIDRYTQRALGLDTQTTTVENFTKPPDYGLALVDINTLLPKYFSGSNVRIFFQVQNYGVNKNLPFIVGCRMEEKEEEKKDAKEEAKKEEKKEDKKKYIIGKVFPQFVEKEKVSVCNIDELENCKMLFSVDKNDAIDFECLFENVQGKGRKPIEIYVIYYSNFTSTHNYYIISESEALNLRKKKQDFFQAYKLNLPQSIYDPREPYKIRIGFYAQPLISGRENKLQFTLEKTWNQDGEIFKLQNIYINFNRDFNLTYYNNKLTNAKMLHLDGNLINCSKNESTLKYSEKAFCNLHKNGVFDIILVTTENNPIHSNEINIRGQLIYVIKKGLEIEIESYEEENEEKK